MSEKSKVEKETNQKREKWLKDNKKAIEGANKEMARDGVFGEKFGIIFRKAP